MPDLWWLMNLAQKVTWVLLTRADTEPKSTPSNLSQIEQTYFGRSPLIFGPFSARMWLSAALISLYSAGYLGTEEKGSCTVQLQLKVDYVLSICALFFFLMWTIFPEIIYMDNMLSTNRYYWNIMQIKWFSHTLLHILFFYLKKTILWLQNYTVAPPLLMLHL